MADNNIPEFDLQPLMDFFKDEAHPPELAESLEEAYDRLLWYLLEDNQFTGSHHTAFSMFMFKNFIRSLKSIRSDKQ